MQSVSWCKRAHVYVYARTCWGGTAVRSKESDKYNISTFHLGLQNVGVFFTQSDQNSLFVEITQCNVVQSIDWTFPHFVLLQTRIQRDLNRLFPI